MAEIVLGVAVSHSPHLMLDPVEWVQRGADDYGATSLVMTDGRIISYDRLVQERGERYQEQSSIAQFEAQAEQVQRALDRIRDAITEARPDVILVIGDDHEEMFSKENITALSVYFGQDVVMRTMSVENMDARPAWDANQLWMRKAYAGSAMDAPHRFPGDPEFARALIDGLLDRGVDVGGIAGVADPAVAGVGHSTGFIVKRLVDVPARVVPLFQNTYYPPCVMRPARCREVGMKIAATINAMPGNYRVAIVASGGLSHFVTDQELDKSVINAVVNHDFGFLDSVPLSALKSGSSEILCWITAAGALESLNSSWFEYIPIFRTPIGTGIGLGFIVME